MKLIAFDQKSIEYAKLKGLYSGEYFISTPHECDCEFCDTKFERLDCPKCGEPHPNCLENLNGIQIFQCMKEGCGHTGISRDDMTRLRKLLEQYENNS